MDRLSTVEMEPYYTQDMNKYTCIKKSGNICQIVVGVIPWGQDYGQNFSV